MKNSISLVIADDHEIFRDGLKLMLSKFKYIQLEGDASNGSELINFVIYKTNVQSVFLSWCLGSLPYAAHLRNAGILSPTRCASGTIGAPPVICLLAPAAHVQKIRHTCPGGVRADRGKGVTARPHMTRLESSPISR